MIDWKSVGRWLMPVTASVALAACGGGDDGTTAGLTRPLAISACGAKALASARMSCPPSAASAATN